MTPVLQNLVQTGCSFMDDPKRFSVQTNFTPCHDSVVIEKIATPLYCVAHIRLKFDWEIIIVVLLLQRAVFMSQYSYGNCEQPLSKNLIYVE